MPVDVMLQARRDEILEIGRQHGVRSIRVFGSAARGAAGPDSDVDFLVELDEGRSLIDLGHLSADLEALLGRRIDLVEPEGLHWYLREQILAEAIPL